MSILSSVIQRGTRAAQPAATTVPVGTVYFVTDEFVVERSTGAAWQSWSAVVFVGDSGAGGTLGLVPIPAAGTAAAGKFLKADATWAVPPGSGGAVTSIQQIVTAASQATVDFTSIPATYSSLRLVWMAQELQAGTAITTLKCKVNNDGTSGNYTSTGRIGAQNGAAFASDIAASAAGVDIGALPQSGNTGIASGGELIIPSYAGTTFHKRLLAHSGEDDGTTNLTVILETSRWKSTAAINRLTMSTTGTGFTNGSVFTLYGWT